MRFKRLSSRTRSGPPPGARSGARRWLGRIAAAGIGLIGALLVAEVGLRLFGVRPALPPAGDPLLGFDQPTGFEARRDFDEYGGTYAIRSNNLGFNEDTDTALEKRPGARRVIVVGDSQTVGVCSNAESFPHRMARYLGDNASDGPYEVLNAGAGRYSPYQYYAKARYRLLALKPDLLVVGIYAGNDYVDLLRQDDRPYLTVDPAGRPVVHPPRFVLFRDPAARISFPSSSRVYAVIRARLGWDLRYKITRARILAETARWNHLSLPRIVGYMREVGRMNRTCPGYLTQSLLQTVWFRRFPETLPVARAVFKQVMLSTRDLCRTSDVELLCVLIPTKQQVERAEMAPAYERIRRASPSWDPVGACELEDAITAAMLDEIRSLGIACVDPRAGMIARARGGALYYPEDQHLNPDGNRVLGELVGERLAGREVLAPATGPGASSGVRP